jgi:predicted nucleic acid-binding protein
MLDLDFFDTNVLIAATVREHVHYAAANARLAKLASSGGACSAHTLAEAYTNLTRLSGGYGRAPQDALVVLEYVQRTFTLVTLTPRETMKAIESLAGLGLPGAIDYDALLIACARKVNACWIYTSNVKHFRRVAPDLASRIVEP